VREKEDYFDDVRPNGKITPLFQLNESALKNKCCKASVLIVDDNMFNLIPLELILNVKFNIDVDMAMNGQEAV
jgi:PleD family two-component response regulator